MKSKFIRILASGTLVFATLGGGFILWFRYSLDHWKLGPLFTLQDIQAVETQVEAVRLLLPQVQAANRPKNQRFVATWRTRASSVTHMWNVTVNVIDTNGVLNGTVLFVNPDGSSRAVAFDGAWVSNGTLAFETKGGKDAITWCLTLEKESNSGVLKGTAGETVIEERVRKVIGVVKSGYH